MSGRLEKMLEFGGIYAELGTAFFRVVVGTVFMMHAIPKIRDPESTKEFFHSVGLPRSMYLVYLAIGIEMVAGATLALGLYTRLSALALTVFMMVASYVAVYEMEKEFEGGYEVDLLLLAASFMYYLNGAGKYALDALL